MGVESTVGTTLPEAGSQWSMGTREGVTGWQEGMWVLKVQPGERRGSAVGQQWWGHTLPGSGAELLALARWEVSHL